MAKLKAKSPLWTLDQALVVVREVGPLVRELDYHLCLGGGVLLTGASEHDLDLWFIPLNGYDSSPFKIMQLCGTIFGLLRSLRDGPDYTANEPWHVKEMHQGNWMGKRVDLFIQ